MGTSNVPAIVGSLVFLANLWTGALYAEDSVGSWVELLSGAKFVRQATSGVTGAESKVKMSWDLCPNGVFYSSQAATASVEAPGSMSLSTNQVTHTGRWSVEIQGSDALLVLTQRDGRRITYHLTSDAGTTFLEGEPVRQTRSTVCP